VIYAPLNGEVLKMTVHDRHGLKNQVLNLTEPGIYLLAIIIRLVLRSKHPPLHYSFPKGKIADV
jgi:hypothetical protein